MAQEFSFDIVSKTEMQEVSNAIQQAQKELAQRFDFKGSKSSIELANDEITLVSDDEGKLRSVKDIVETKLIKRGVSLKALDYGKLEDASLGKDAPAERLRLLLDVKQPGDERTHDRDEDMFVFEYRGREFHTRFASGFSAGIHRGWLFGARIQVLPSCRRNHG